MGDADSGTWSEDELDADAPHGVDSNFQIAAIERRLFGADPQPLQLGRFTLLERVGAGAMGTVYQAHDPALDRTVAVKIIRSGLLDFDATRTRMLREAKTLARLNHPHILTVFDVGFRDDQVFIATEFVAGGTLHDWCRVHPPGGRARWNRLLALARQAAEGLSAAHEAGLVHRDVKPSNMLVGADDRLRVADFGLARRLDAAELVESSPSMTQSDARDSQLTRTGSAVGTPAYMAPEQFRGVADARSDQFGWAVSFFEATYGMRPFPGRTPTELLDATEQGRIASTHAPAGVPSWLRPVLERCLQAEPSRRFASMRAVLDALDRSHRRGRRRLQLAGAAIVAGLAATPWLLREDAPCADDPMASTWNETQRERVASSLTRSGLADAAHIAARATEELDAYADRWRDGHREACEATHVHRTQSMQLLDERMRCLGDRRRAIVAIVGVLAEADERVSARAIETIADLPVVEACADPRYVSAATVPPEPAIAAEVDALRDELARVDALHGAARHDEAHAGAVRIVDAAAALDWEPLWARATFRRGAIEAALGDPHTAATSLDDALLAAQRVGDDETVFEAATALTYVVGVKLLRTDEARRWGELAFATAARLGSEHDHRRARAQLAMGQIDGVAGDYDAAIATFEDARTRLGEGARDALLLARVLEAEAKTRAARGEAERALAQLEEALAIRERELGPGHPSIAPLWSGIGRSLHALGRDEDALRALERALELREQVFGDAHTEVADSLGMLAILQLDRGHDDEALSHLLRALAIYESTYGVDDDRVASCLTNIANVHLERGEYAEAIDPLERALAIREYTLGAEHPATAVTLGNLGSAYLEVGDADAAIAQLDRALAIEQRTLGEAHVDLAYSLTARGDAQQRRGRHAEAIADLERALALRTSTTVRPELLAQTRFLLARALWDGTVDRDRARRLAEQALEHADGLPASERDAVARWLAEHPEAKPPVAPR